MPFIRFKSVMIRRNMMSVIIGYDSRFLKQELNFSHFLSLNENGIQVVLYITLITAMLVMIYKKENEIGCKTTIRRMGIELESVVLAIVVIQSGGDLRKTYKSYPKLCKTKSRSPGYLCTRIKKKLWQII